MKKKNRHSVLRRLKEFRFHKVKDKSKKKWLKRHPTYIFLQQGNVYFYVALTHASTIDGYLLIKLRENPNPSDSRESYYIAEIKYDTKDNFSANKADWKINELDDVEIRKLFTKKDDSADRE